MADENTVTLELTGEVPIESFVKALTEFNGLIAALSQEVGGTKAKAEWVVSDLRAGSAITTIRGFSTDDDLIAQVIQAFTNLGRSMKSDEPLAYSPRVRKKAKALTTVIGDHVKAVVLGTVRERFEIVTPLEMKRQDTLYRRSTVVGSVHTLNDRKHIEFVLYDALFDRPVHCYATEETKDLLRDIWGKRVTVIGRVGRKPDTGYPFEVKDIENIIIAPQIVERQFESARGILAPGIDEQPEVTIGRMRDGE